MSEAWETLQWVGHDSYLAVGDSSIPAAKQSEALQPPTYASELSTTTAATSRQPSHSEIGWSIKRS